jgi:hypothetical protein
MDDTGVLWHDASEADGFNSINHDFIWNADFTRFRVIQLRWHADSSYRKYQAADSPGGQLYLEAVSIAP